ncbi:hypothetical protein PM082_022208 [Marasmius tenuissimus]|nr:hypothetical protein PM082_022208 [Marasmius tenuissimus]
MYVKDLSDFARHGLLTFGAVVDHNESEILAHLPSCPSPQWYFQNLSVGASASYSATVFTTDVRFSIVGTMQNNSKSSTPIYLFVPPISVEHINGMYSIRYPLVDPSFNWSFDPNGRQVIPEKDWEMHGLAKLEVLWWIGSCWDSSEYWAVLRHLQMKNTDLDGRRYAEERGYPELVQSGPPEQRMFDLFDSKESNTDKDPSRSPCSREYPPAPEKH